MAKPLTRIVRLLGAYALMVTALYLLPLDRLSFERSGLRWLLFILAVVALAALLTISAVRASSADPSTTVDGLVVAIGLAVMVFAAVYDELAHTSGQFAELQTRTDALYFTVSTLATVGFGDVHATGQAARIVVTVQIVFNLVFVATAAGTLSHTLRRNAARRASRTEM